MIPLLIAAMMSREPASAPPTGALITYFLADDPNTHAMTTAENVNTAAVYNQPGDPADSLQFYVRKSGVTTLWGTIALSPPAENTAQSELFSSVAPGWAGAGAYDLWVLARRVSTGLYDVTSNTIALTVS